MSGPITCGYILTQALLSLSARAIEEARAMGREYGAVLAQMAEREAALGQARHGRQAARLERIAALRGTLSIHSAPGAGTDVFVCVPVFEAPEEEGSHE